MAQQQEFRIMLVEKPQSTSWPYYVERRVRVLGLWWSDWKRMYTTLGKSDRYEYWVFNNVERAEKIINLFIADQQPVPKPNPLLVKTLRFP